MYPTISNTNLNLKCGFLIIHLGVQLGKQEHFMVNLILVCRQGISRGVGEVEVARFSYVDFLRAVCSGVCWYVFASTLK